MIPPGVALATKSHNQNFDPVKNIRQFQEVFDPLKKTTGFTCNPFHAYQKLLTRRIPLTLT
jgi:hypothetical protein